MVEKVYDIDPHVPGSVRIGSSKNENVVLAGRMAERGNREEILFDGSENFVVLEVGKRGSGKSYGMGALLEGFATQDGSAISSHETARGVLLIEPLDIHWTAVEPLRPDGPEGMVRQHEIVKRWGGLDVEPINVRVFMPAGFSLALDHPRFLSYQLPVSDLTAGDWAHLLACDLVKEPRGRLVGEVHRKVTRLGWLRDGRKVAPKSDYTVQDLIDCAEHDDEVEDFFHSETIRSVVQPFRSYAAMPLFDTMTGTPLTTLISGGILTVLCLGRLPASIRTVLTTVLIRKLRADRMEASQISRRLALEDMDEDTRAELKEALATHVPRTILGIDEAQILIPSRSSSTARKELEAYVLEGRNYGLSLWMATQRPKGAISSAAASQIDTFIVHRLSVKSDIDAMCGLLQSATPNKIRLRGRTLELPDLIRSLDVGQAVFSSANSSAPRLVVGTVRPRMTAHGGDEF
jgi:hypothetical protein